MKNHIAEKSPISFFILLLVLCSGKILATTYYINVNGNDTNSGLSSAAAWKTIAKVNSIDFKPGDKILFAGGQTFSGNLYFDAADGNDSTYVVTVSSYGIGRAIIEAGNDFGIYVYNTQGFTISNLIIEGSGMGTNTADGVAFYGDLDGNFKFKKITIKSIEVRNFGQAGINIGSWNNNTGYKNLIVDKVEVHHVRADGITIWGFTEQTHVGWPHKNIRVMNSHVHDVTGYSTSSNKGSGIIMGQVDQGLIDRCVTHDNGTGNTHCGGPGGIWAWDSNNIIIERCESYHNSKGSGCDGFGFDLDGGVTNSTMEYNYSHDNDGAGFFMGQYAYARPWSNNTVRYNISENDGRANAGAVSIFKGPGTTMSGLKIYQNTIYVTPTELNTAVAAFTIKKWSTGISNVSVYNNIFQTTDGIPLVSIPSGYSAYFAGNLYWTSNASFKIKYQDVTYYNLADWQTATNNEKVGTTLTGIVADPLLTNAGVGGTVYPSLTESLNAYKLSAASPAIDSGLNLSTAFKVKAGSRDFFADATANGTLPDIGSFESAPTTARLPVEETDTLEITDDNFIYMFPNPVSGDSAVELRRDNFSLCSVTIFSMTGSSVWKTENEKRDVIVIPTHGLQSGVYVVQMIEGNGKVINQKLVVE